MPHFYLNGKTRMEYEKRLRYCCRSKMAAGMTKDNARCERAGRVTSWDWIKSCVSTLCFVLWLRFSAFQVKNTIIQGVCVLIWVKSVFKGFKRRFLWLGMLKGRLLTNPLWYQSLSVQRGNRGGDNENVKRKNHSAGRHKETKKGR